MHKAHITKQNISIDISQLQKESIERRRNVQF